MTSTFAISRLYDMSALVEIGLPLWIEGVFHQLNLHLHHDLHLHHFSNLSLMEIVVKGEAGLPLWVEGVFEGLRPPHLLPLPANSTLKIFRLSVWIFAHVTLCIIWTTKQIWQIFCEKLINILWKCFLQTLIHSLKWGFPERIQIERHCNPVSASRNQNPSFIEVFLEFQQKYYMKFASKGNTYYEIPNWVQLSALRNQKGDMKLSIEHNYLKYMSGRKAKVPNFTSCSYWGRSIKLPTFKIYDTPAQDVLQISSDLSV